MNIYILGYALLLLVGGLVGYLKAGSLPSLIMGSSCAIIFGILAFIRTKMAHLIAIAMTLLLFGFFGYRFAVSLKFMPAGLMSLASIGLLIKLWRERASSSAYYKSDKDKCCTPSSHKKP